VPAPVDVNEVTVLGPAAVQVPVSTIPVLFEFIAAPDIAVAGFPPSYELP
jgi:hypothetical protein